MADVVERVLVALKGNSKHYYISQLIHFSGQEYQQVANFSLKPNSAHQSNVLCYKDLDKKVEAITQLEEALLDGIALEVFHISLNLIMSNAIPKL